MYIVEEIAFTLGFAASNISLISWVVVLIASMFVHNWRDSLLVGVIVMVPNIIPVLVGIGYNAGQTGNMHLSKWHFYSLPAASALGVFVVVMAIHTIKRIVVNRRGP